MFICLYSLSFSLSSFVYCYRFRFEFPDFSVFPRPSPRDLFRVVVGRGRKEEFFPEGAKIAYTSLYPFPLPPGTKRRNIQGEGRMRFPDLDLVLSHIPPPLFHPLSFLVDVEIFFHRDHPRAPFTALLGRLIELQRRISSGSDWIFPNHCLPPHEKRKRPLGNGIGYFIHTCACPRTNTGCSIFNVLQEDTEGGRYPKGESMIVDEGRVIVD